MGWEPGVWELVAASLEQVIDWGPVSISGAIPRSGVIQPPFLSRGVRRENQSSWGAKSSPGQPAGSRPHVRIEQGSPWPDTSCCE